MDKCRRLGNELEDQFRWDVSLWQTCHEFSDKSSKIVPLGAPLFLILQSSIRSLLRADPKAGRSLSARSLRIIQRPIDAVLLICRLVIS
jgi:hypothetical protein